LRLSPAVVRGFTPGLPLASMFTARQVALLAPMELMTNPIDLMNHVMTVLGELAASFAAGERCLSFDDTLILMMAVMSLNPPANAVAIAAYLRKWERVQLCAIVAHATNYFVAAVQQLREYPWEERPFGGG
jgi:hypothetical protein